MSDNAIIDALFEGVEFERTTKERRSAVDAEYGKGRWKDATPMEIDRREGQYGRSVMVKTNLTGSEEAKDLTFFVDAPAKPHTNGGAVDEKVQKRYEIGLNRIKTLVHSTGLWCTFNAKGYVSDTDWPPNFDDFADDEQFDKLVALFTSFIGQKMPINVKYRKYTNKAGEEKLARDVWGLDARKGE